MVSTFFAQICALCMFLRAIVISSIDPADFFKGAHQRPKLEILYPENGCILDSGNLEVVVNLRGYVFPSAFHDSSVCIGLSTGDTFLEECFVEAPDLKFHVGGLRADTGYAVRVIFFERGEAIAVSVRNFRVGGIKGVVGGDASDPEEVVMIQTAVQVALQHQLNGNFEEAKRIYNSILSINPAHPYTLHLLGLSAFQSGDAEGALPYLQKALQAVQQHGGGGGGDAVSGKVTPMATANASPGSGAVAESSHGVSTTSVDMIGPYDGFHNSLGECYRVLGQFSAAEHHYRMAMKINPADPQGVVRYNLGLLYQQTSQWTRAVYLYQQVVAAYSSEFGDNTEDLLDRDAVEDDSVDGTLRLESSAKASENAGSDLEADGEVVMCEHGAPNEGGSCPIAAEVNGDTSPPVPPTRSNAPKDSENYTTTFAPDADSDADSRAAKAQRREERRQQRDMVLNAKIRECDLLQTLYFSAGSKNSDGGEAYAAGSGTRAGAGSTMPDDMKYDFEDAPGAEGGGTAEDRYSSANQAIANCWLHGIQLFPHSDVMYNELGNLLLRVGQYADAVPMYRTAVSLGNKVAQVNLAHVLEGMGHADESRAAFQALVAYAISEDYLPYTHFLLRQITVNPRVLPHSDKKIRELRKKMNLDLDMFLQLDSMNDDFHVDNSAPLHFGFYTGFYWTYQINSLEPYSSSNGGSSINSTAKRALAQAHSIERSNVILKTKLYHAYLKFCPALSQGVFMEALGRKVSTATASQPAEDAVSSDVALSNARKNNTNMNDTSLNGDSSPREFSREQGVPDAAAAHASTASALLSKTETRLTRDPLLFRLLYTENDEVYLRMHAEGGVRVVDIAARAGAETSKEGGGGSPASVGLGSQRHGVVAPLNQVPHSSSIAFSKRKLAKKSSGKGFGASTLLTESGLKQSTGANAVRDNPSATGGEISVTSGIGSGRRHSTDQPPGGRGSRPPIKIGFISRFFRVHSVGILCEGIIKRLSESAEFEVHVFLVDGTGIAKTTGESADMGDDSKFQKQHDSRKSAGYRNDEDSPYHDPVRASITYHADFTYYLSTDISEISQFIRPLKLDILVYPEIGIDIVSYFLSFTRLARVQAAWVGHPDTTGVASIDYFISTDMLPEQIAHAEALHNRAKNRTLVVSADGERAAAVSTELNGADKEPGPPHGKQHKQQLDQERFQHLDKKQAKEMYEQQQKQARLLKKKAIVPFGGDKTPVKPEMEEEDEDEDYTDGLRGRSRRPYRSIAPTLSSPAASTTPARFSEDNVFVMRNMGTFFQDSYAEYAKLLHRAPRTALLDRGKFIDYLHLPRTAHIILLVQPLYKLHGVFDDAIAKILTQDRLAHLIVVDSVNVTSWQNLFIDRISAHTNAFDAKDRILFFVTATMEDTLTAMSAAHVLLDPFPVSGYLPTMQALSIGLPVVTLPTDVLAGRMGLVLYNMLGYYELVCSSIAEYVSLVHNITHNPRTRAHHVEQITALRGNLFEGAEQAAVEDWRALISNMIAFAEAREAREKRSENQCNAHQPHSGGDKQKGNNTDLVGS